MEKFKEIVQFIRELYDQPDGIISLHAPVFNGNEKKYLNECIDTTFVSSVGKFVDQFEIEMAEYTGSKKAVACVNGTSALHLALKLAGVEPGDEVITQPLTFIATANAITYCGAEPVFLDVDMDTMGLSPLALKSWLDKNVVLKTGGKTQLSFLSSTAEPKPFNKLTGKRIAACVPMHTFGHPCRIDELIEFCNQYKIPVIEDAAESLGSFYRGKHTGTFGKIGVLSFNGNKIITTGGGGMLLFQDEELAKYAKHLTTQAKVPHPWEFVHDETGFNYRMPNINAALGLAQLEQLIGFLRLKKTIATKYEHFFRGMNISYMVQPNDTSPNFWLNAILFENKAERDEFLKYSNGAGVMTRPAWQLMNKMGMYKYCQSDTLTNVFDLANRLVNIPSSVK